MKWISVEDKLPKTTDEVLVYSEDDDSMDVGYYNGDWYGSVFSEDEITHWQKLPKPPKD